MPYHELTIRIPNLFRDMLIKRLTQKGCLGVIEGKDTIIAYFPDANDIDIITNELVVQKALLEKTNNEHQLTFDYNLIPDQDWNESWKKGFRPLDVGEYFTIIPPWEDKRSGRINLIIDPGMAFGTGHHETTRSCLVLMEKYDGKVAKGHFLDLGTGTGLLAIAASKLGYDRVVAVDTDPLAIEAARKNLDLNQVINIELREGSIAEAPGTFDCITANIISGVLVFLAPEISSRLKPSGLAILSGILAEQADDVIKAYEQTGLKIIENFPDDKWASLIFQN
jgi:ribosomal protein L11 methyltransferase